MLVTVNSGDFPTFYLCPGGGQDHGEDAYEALRRECREEIGCDVVVGELAFVTRAVNDASFLSVGVYAFTTVFFLLIAIVLTTLGQRYQRRYPAR